MTSGFERRNINWQASRARYDIGTGTALNFRGEPHIPDNDKVFSYPVRD